MEDSRQVIDPVRPGEQWFCYWKTSASQWESRIQEFPQNEIIFIPVYWGFHAETGGAWDFGKYHPERDLVRLLALLTQHGRKFCWLLPLTPAPFLPNGGVPTTAARMLSLSAQGMHLACLDQDGTLHKIYSFYESKVVPNFASFVQAFGEMLSQSKTKSRVWGAEFDYLENETIVSFLNDSSVAFEQGFSRYLKKNFPDGVELNQAYDEQKIKLSYQSDVRNLFHSLAQDSLAPFWEGVQAITILGSGPKDTIERALSAGKSQTHFFKDLFESYVSHRWFSTCLLTTKEKKDLLRRCLNEHFASEEIEHRFHYLTASSEIGPDFRPYALIDVFDHHLPKVFEKNGLKPFINDNFRWMFHLHGQLDFTPQWIDSSYHRVKFFHAEGMDRTLFAQMLKLFMMGQRIVFDCTNLSDELDKRLQVFYLENNLKLQSVNFLTSINLCELGEGRLITFEGNKLKTSEDKSKFWGHMFKFLNMNHPEVHTDQDIFSLWRIRATSPHELNYLDVRRVNFYNPTSYKKSVMVHTQKKFAFMKVIDPLHATAKMTNDGVEVELLPNGKLALDFGHYEERT
ncbi:MAG: hypothetical protein H0V66_01625 [Bdellovibrionales bacterium]|nr:hypothetical protein [Bdellovibrionales bacterium]